MLKKFGLSLAAAAAVFLAACGGGSGDSSGGSNGGSQPQTVSGPLDTVQTTVSSAVLGPLESATANTPLVGVLVCTDAAVNGNLLDLVDALLNGLQNPSSLSSTTPAEVQAQLLQFAQNLGRLLTALSGQNACASGTSGGSGIPTTNPLAGTPLAPLGDALLPVLQQIQSQLGGGGGSGQTGFAELAALVTALNSALQTAVAQLPSSATSAPVISGVLVTLKDTLADVSGLLGAIAVDNKTAFTNTMQKTLYDVLVDVATQIVPATYLENQAGKPGTITGPVKQAASQLSAQLAEALSIGTSPLVDVLNSSQLAPVLGPIENQLLPAIVGPIIQALNGIGGGSGTITGTPLDGALAALTQVLGSLLGGGSGGGGGTCVFANIPVLSTLCAVLP
ncbi:MAG: hypothetical protein QJR02_10065 [Sinobacteraceae bacterium]|nr:hypothetical protein [Nevskiaceae bacterium]